MTRSFVRSLLGVALIVPVAVAPPRTMAPPRLSGTIVAAAGTPLANARMSIRGQPGGAISDSAGAWALAVPEALRGKGVVLEARAIGYQPSTISLVANGDSAGIRIVMQPAVLALQSVVVSGTADTKRVTLGASVVSVRGMATLPAGSVPAPAPARDRTHNTEGYAAISENEFRSASDVPLSTFGVDVDRASYTNLRRMVRLGQLPPVDAVRLEELVNYFPYDYEAPAAASRDPVRFTADVAVAPWAPQHRLVRVALKAKQVDTRNIPPSNLVFLIDVSGSMQDPLKLPLLKQAYLMLVDQLREQDRVAIVVYAGAAGLVLPSTPGSRKAEIRAAIAGLEAGGSTAGGAGITLAYQVAREHFIRGGNNRVILATDGDFNVGASSDAEMERLIEARRAEGTFLTVLGFGMGNLKDSKLETLADKGNGNYAYIDSPLEARKVLVQEMGATLLTVAKDVKLQVEFNPAHVASWRLLGYENRLLNDEDFRDDTKDAGDMGAGHTVTAFYEVVPRGAAIDPSRPVDPLRYQVDRVSDPRHAGELLQVKMRFKDRDGSTSRELRTVVHDRPVALRDDFAFASAVAELAMVVRDSKHRGGASLASVLERAESARGDDPHGYRQEFIAMARAWGTLTKGVAAPDLRR